MADNWRRRSEQERYGYRDDERDRWRAEGGIGGERRGGRYGEFRGGGYGGYDREEDRGGGRGFRRGDTTGAGYVGGGYGAEDYGRGYGEGREGRYGGGYRGERYGGYGRDEERGGYGRRAYGPAYRYEGGMGGGYESNRRGMSGYGGQREADYAGGGHNAREAARDFGGGLGFGTGYGGARDYDPGREADEPYLGGMYYGGGEVRTDMRQGTGYGRDYGHDDGRERGRDERGFLERAGDTVASWFGADEDGQHRGRGPKGYQRSDERIRDDVNDRLTDDPYLDASDIEVEVTGREVTLSGTVNRREDKRRAEDVAESVSGVTHVQNNLRVQQNAMSEMGGSTGAARVEGPSGAGMTGTGDQDATAGSRNRATRKAGTAT